VFVSEAVREGVEKFVSGTAKSRAAIAEGVKDAAYCQNMAQQAAAVPTQKQ
jgi:hypothetical protein